MRLKVIWFIFTAIVPLFAVNAAHADIAFDVTVLRRQIPAQDPPVTRVVILLDVNTDPVNKTVTIDNFGGSDGSDPSTPTTLTILDTPPFPFPKLGNTKDRAAAYRGVGNQLVIEVLPKSWLLDPLDLCSIDNSSNKNKKFGFSVTGMTSSGYRMSSYSVAANIDPSSHFAEQCTCASARVRVDAAHFNTPPGGTNKGRLPYDVFLVLDRSGSMNSPAPNEVINKLPILRQAVGEYIEAWKAEQTNAPAGTDLSDDQLGLVWFSTSSMTQFPLTKRGPLNANPHPWDQLETAVENQPADGSTALGGGLRDGIKGLANTKIGDRVVLLVTDGLQNQAPMVTPPTGAGTKKSLDLGNGGPEILANQCVRVYTVGIGSSLEMVAGELLDAIANQCAGTSKIVSGDFAAGALGDHLVEMLTGNTLALVTRTEGQFALRQGRSDKIPVTVDGSAKYLIAVIGWSPREQFTNTLDLRFGDTNAHSINPERRADKPFYIVQRFAVPAPGNYVFQVTDAAPIILLHAPSAAASEVTVPYHLSIYAIEANLDFRVAFGAPHHGTGDPLKLDIQVSLDGVGVKNIANGIKIHVQRPGDGIGNQLHNSTVSGGSGSGSGSGNPDSPSAYEQKLSALTQDPNFQKAVAAQTDPNILAVKEIGGGNYSAVLASSGTTVPGKYHFDIFLEFTNPQNGQPIRRQKVLETAVEVIPDPQQSAVTIAGNGPTFDITIVPRDRFGNYKGPGYDGIVNVAVTGGGRIDGTPADGQQQGIYVVHLVDVPAGGDPVVTVEIGGTVLGKKPISVWKNGERGCFHCFGSSGSATTPSKVGTLGTLVLIGLVAYRRRRR